MRNPLRLTIHGTAGAVAAAAVALAAMSSTSHVRAQNAAPAQGAAAAAATLVESRALFAEKCSACHDLPDPAERNLTRDEWQRTVNLMLDRYGASDSISPAEAAQIVDYLATFAVVSHRGTEPTDPWATEADDVWSISPLRTSIINFTDPTVLRRLHAESGGDAGPAARWSVTPDVETPVGAVARVSQAGAGAGRFAILVNPDVNGVDIDVRVRFRIIAGRTSPAVGIAFGLTDTSHYDVVRFDRTDDTLVLIDIDGIRHTTVQTTDIENTPVAGTLANTQSVGSSGMGTPMAGPAIAPTGPSVSDGWHLLHVMVSAGRVRAWVDGEKRIGAGLPRYTGGSVALWSQGDTTTVFDGWYTNVYHSSEGDGTAE
ncbi:MAG: c-type cytochrome [Capsulimonadaceae bacterium]